MVDRQRGCDRWTNASHGMRGGRGVPVIRGVKWTIGSVGKGDTRRGASDRLQTWRMRELQAVGQGDQRGPVAGRGGRTSQRKENIHHHCRRTGDLPW
jgi:hypothetical protein